MGLLVITDPISPTLKHSSSKLVQFKYCLPGRAARRSNISHMVGCLSFDVQLAASKLLRIIKRCGTHSLIVLNLRDRTANRVDYRRADYRRVESIAATLLKLTRAYFQIGGNLRSRRRAGKPSSPVASYCTTKRASSRDSPRARDASIASFAERAALLSATGQKAG